MDAVRIISIVFGSLMMGALLGLIPFFFGRKKGHDTMGLVCMLVCMLASFLAGLYLSVPACLISVIVIAVQKKTGGNTGPYSDPYRNQYPNQYPNPYMSQDPNQYTNQYVNQDPNRNTNQYVNQDPNRYPNPGQGADSYYAGSQQAWQPGGSPQDPGAGWQNVSCPSCGTQLKPGTAYCTNCGKKL